MNGAFEAARAAAITAATGHPDDDVGEVRREPLEYDAFLAHRSVHRLRGDVRHAEGPGGWSMIEKTTEGPHLASPYLRDNAEREHAAYTSGLLEHLAPGLRAPRLLGAHEDVDGRLTLWLEDVEDEASRPLEAGALLATAHDLGALAGRHLESVPEAPRLFTGWITRHAQDSASAEGLRTLGSARPETAARLGHRIDEVRRLILAQPRLRAMLEQLPQTLCHHDAVGANLLRSGGSTVLIDWESVGPGPAGADLASLLFASVRRGDASAQVVLPLVEDAVSAYLDGLAGQRAGVDAAGVRRGVRAAICLRWKLAVDVVRTLETGEPAHRGSAPDEAPEQALEELLQLAGLLLDTARRVLGDGEDA